MRSVILVLYLFIYTTSFAQKGESIIGTWKVLSLSNDELYYDVKADSIWIHHKNNLAEISSPGEKDIAELLKAMGSLKFVFKTNGKFEQTFQGILDTEGDYIVDTSRKNIKTKVKKNGTIIEEEMGYALKDRKLFLHMNWEENSVNLTLEKLEK